jgi:hypothetical protein
MTVKSFVKTIFVQGKEGDIWQKMSFVRLKTVISGPKETNAAPIRFTWSAMQDQTLLVLMKPTVKRLSQILPNNQKSPANDAGDFLL